MNFRKSLLIIIFGFFAGTAISSFINLDFWFALFLALLSLILRLSQSRESRNFIISLFILGIGFGILRYEIKDFKNNIPYEILNKKTVFEAIILKEPEEHENYIRLIAEISGKSGSCPELKNEDCKNFLALQEPKIQNQKILIYSRQYPKFNFGDKITITGKIQKPQKFDGINTNKFNWPAYLAKDDIYLETFYPEIKLISSGNGSKTKQILFSLKKRFTENIEKTISFPASSLLSGITIGEKNSLPKDLKDNLIKTGTIHIAVLSGYNITIIAASVINILKLAYLPNMIVSAFGILTVVLFTVTAGAEAATVRAAIMAVLIIIANQTGRMYAAMYALIFAAFFMIIANPMILRFDASFQLSFLATFGLIYFTPYFENKLKSIPEILKIKENFITTMSAQITVLPLLIYSTGSFSLFSLPLNILILSFIPITMFFGFLTGVSGFLSFYLSYFLGLITYVFLAYEIWLINFFANLPFSYIKIF